MQNQLCVSHQLKCIVRYYLVIRQLFSEDVCGGVSVVKEHQIAITCSFQDLQIPMQVSGFPDTPSLPRSTTPPLSLYRIHFHSRVSRYLLRSCLVSDQSLPFHTLTVLQCYNKGKGGRSITGHFHCFSPVLVQNFEAKCYAPGAISQCLFNI